MAYRNLTETLASLNERTLDVIDTETAHGEGDAILSSIQTTPMADGSGRWCSICHMQMKDGGEYQITVAAPAPADAPKWAQVHGDFEVNFNHDPYGS